MKTYLSTFLFLSINLKAAYITSWNLTIDSSVKTFNGIKKELDEINNKLNNAIDKIHQIEDKNITIEQFSIEHKALDDIPAVYIPTRYLLYVKILNYNGSYYAEKLLKDLFPKNQLQLHDYGHAMISKNKIIPKFYRLIKIVSKSGCALNSSVFSAIKEKYSPKIITNKQNDKACILYKLPNDFIEKRADLDFKELYAQEQKKIIQNFIDDNSIILTIIAHGSSAKYIYYEKYKKLQNKNIAFDLVEKTFADFGKTEIIKQYYENKKNLKNLTRFVRVKLIEEQNIEIIKNKFKTWLKQAYNLEGTFLEEFAFHVKFMQNVLASEEFLKDIPSKLCVAKIDGIRPFNSSLVANYINKITNFKSEVLLSSIEQYDADTVFNKLTLEDKVVVFLLNKENYYHCAPLIRIDHDDEIYWVLLECNAKSDNWFLSTNFITFFDCLNLFIETEKKYNPSKKIFGFMNRIQLITQETGCEVIAFLNCRAIAINLSEFISFLKECDHTNKKDDIIIFPSLPHFISTNKQGISNLKEITYENASEEALKTMVLMPLSSENNKLANANIVLGSVEILEKLVDEITLNKNENSKDIYDIETCVIQ